MTKEIEAILEALFFATDEPLPMERLYEVVQDCSKDDIDASFQSWRDSLESEEGRGLQIIEVAGGFLLATQPAQTVYVDRLLERRKKRTLSQAALETLAIIAYRQPITRAEIEGIRGVNVDSMIHTLLERRLIKISGRKDVPGHPFMYRVTKQFLNHFGLRDIQELPRIDELSEALASAENEEEEGGEGVQGELPLEESTSEEPIEVGEEKG